jgi:hypothetical protein
MGQTGELFDVCYVLFDICYHLLFDTIVYTRYFSAYSIRHHILEKHP